jgi:hypothetical protein
VADPAENKTDGLSTPPPAFRSPSQIDPVELAKAFAEDGVITPEKAAEVAKAVAPKVEEKPAAASGEKPGTEKPKTLLDLAKDRDARRKEAEARGLDAARPMLEVVKDVDPNRLAAVARAMKAGDMVGLIAAAGGTHSQYTSQLLGAKDPAKPAAAPEPVQPSETETLKERIARLEAERTETQIANGRREYIGFIDSQIKDKPEFKALNATEGAAEMVEQTLIQFWKDNGQSWPEGVSREDLVTLAARDVEAKVIADIAAQEKRIAKYRGLTPAPASGAVAPQKKAPADPPPPGNDSPRTLTNDNTTAPAAVRPAPNSREAVLEAIIRGDDAALNALG